MKSERRVDGATSGRKDLAPSGFSLLTNCLDFVVKTVTRRVWTDPTLLNFSDLMETDVNAAGALPLLEGYIGGVPFGGEL